MRLRRRLTLLDIDIGYIVVPVNMHSKERTAEMITKLKKAGWIEELK